MVFKRVTSPSSLTRLVLLQRRAHGIDLSHQIRPSACGDLPAQDVDVGGGSFAKLDLAIGLFWIVAEQKILFGAPALQQFNLDLAGKLRNLPRSGRGISKGGLCPLTIKVDAADHNDADHADHAD